MVLLSCTCTITCSGYVHTITDSFGTGTKIIPDSQGFCSQIRTVISTRYSVRSNWNLEVFVHPRTQACSRYPSDQRRLGTERDSVLGEFSRQD